MPLRIGTSSWPAALTTAKVRTQTLYMWQVPYDGMVVLCTPEKSVASRLMHPAILSASYTAHVCGQRVFAAAPSFVCRSGAQTAKNDTVYFHSDTRKTLAKSLALRIPNACRLMQARVVNVT